MGKEYSYNRDCAVCGGTVEDVDWCDDCQDYHHWDCRRVYTPRITNELLKDESDDKDQP